MSLIKDTNIISPVSAFGDHATVAITPILQYAFEYNMVDNTRYWTLTETNGGTVTTSAAQAVVNTSTTASSVAAMRSVRPARYRAGLGAKFRFTAKFSAAATSCKQIIGIFDETGSTTVYKNGYGIGYDGTTFKLIHYLNDADVSVNLSAADDPLDGTGASGITIDQTKLNIFEIDFAYLGTGDIIFKIYSTIQNRFVEFHRIQRANAQTVPHSYNPNYKVTLYADNAGTTSDVTVSTASMMYAIMGHVDIQETHQLSFGYDTSLGSVTTQTQIFSIRSKTTYTSVTNLVDSILENFSGSYNANAAATGNFEIQINPTLNGVASWADIDATDSIMEVDTAQTTVSAAGRTILKAYVAGQYDRVNLIELVSENIYISPGDEVAVLVESSASATFNAFLSWKELF